MNCIFIKEVASKVINRKIISEKKTKISEEKDIIEIYLNKEKLDKVIKSTVEINKYEKSNKKTIDKLNLKEIFNNMKNKLFIKIIERKILKYFTESKHIKYLYCFSNEIQNQKSKTEYLEKIMESLKLNKYTFESEMKQNINKYIKEYSSKKNLKEQELKVLLLVKEENNIDYNLVVKLIKKYKEVNILLAQKSLSLVTNKLKNINDEYGTTVDVSNKNAKKLKEYDVYIFIDRRSTEFSNYRIAKKACNIELTTKESDKYNSNYIELEKKVKEGNYDKKTIKMFYEIYGKITIANYINSNH